MKLTNIKNKIRELVLRSRLSNCKHPDLNPARLLNPQSYKK